MKVVIKTFLLAVSTLAITACSCHKSRQDSVMSDAYWKIWNKEVQTKIDNDIEKYRKANATVKLENLPAGTEVKVEQVSHDFIFGAHIFNFNQLGTPERNQKYRELFGTLFNRATVPFYWTQFELQPGHPRFAGEEWDTEEFWNNCEEPEKQPHWRRPATDPIVEFCESRDVQMHGHCIVWRSWHGYPRWIYEQYCPADEKKRIGKYIHYQLDDKTDKDKAALKELEQMNPDSIFALAPVFCKNIDNLYKKRMNELAAHYGNRLQSWDIVNESSVDFHGNSNTGAPIQVSVNQNLMPGDYVYKAFMQADSVFPKEVLLNINDYIKDKNYLDQVKDLQELGCRIDVLGWQMHLFNPQYVLDIAEGKRIVDGNWDISRWAYPDGIWENMKLFSQAGLPIHVSEITITSANDDERGRAIQAVIARNLYRLWFSIEKMMGITWWNVVDGCAVATENNPSGLFTRNMEPKPAFYALDELINHEWKTNLTVKANKDGTVKFRGFKGKYKLVWKDKSGNENTSSFYLKNDGIWIMTNRK